MIQTKKLSLRAFIVGLAAMAFALLVPALAASQVSAAGTYCSGPSVCIIYGTPNPGNVTFTLGNGAPVGMQCWQDGIWHTVNYSSNRWFKVNNPIIGIQWAHSSEIFNQITVPAC